MEEVGSVFGAPLTNDQLGVRVSVEGTDPDARQGSVFRPATAGCFDTLGIPILRGRGFEEADVSSGEPVTVINDQSRPASHRDGHPHRSEVAVFEFRTVVSGVRLSTRVRVTLRRALCRARRYGRHSGSPRPQPKPERSGQRLALPFTVIEQ